MKRVGHLFAKGEAFGSFGELAQGRLSDQTDFLITLPIELKSVCHALARFRSGPGKVSCAHPKSKLAATKILAQAGVTEDYDIRLELTRSIPIGKGLSSSTADMMAVVRALEKILGLHASTDQISRVFSEIEPHDGLMFSNCVAYDHRSGRLLRGFDYVPDYWIVGVDIGGHLDTVEYNRNLSFSHDVMRAYDRLLENVSGAFKERDDAEIARLATESTLLHVVRSGDPQRVRLLNETQDLSPLGYVNTHSGTCVGLLYPKLKPSQEIAAIAAVIEARFGWKSLVTSTIPHTSKLASSLASSMTSMEIRRAHS